MNKKSFLYVIFNAYSSFSSCAFCSVSCLFSLEFCAAAFSPRLNECIRPMLPPAMNNTSISHITISGSPISLFQKLNTIIRSVPLIYTPHESKRKCFGRIVSFLSLPKNKKRKNSRIEKIKKKIETTCT